MPAMSKPETTDRLSIAESWQLSMDYQKDSEVQERIARYYGRKIDEFEYFDGILADFDDAVNKQAGYEQRLTKLNYSGREFDEMSSAIYGTAAEFVRTKKSDLRNSNSIITELGESLSVGMVDYIQQELPETKTFRINGTDYYCEDSVLARQAPLDGKSHIAVFGGDEVARKVNIKYFERMSPTQTHAHPANPQEWQQLSHDLKTVAKF